MREKEIESYLVKQVKSVGGRADKFSSPGNTGVPDRIVIFPGGKIVFVETKAPGKKVTVLQDRQITKLRNLGCTVKVIDSKLGADELIKEYSDRYGV